MNQTTVIRAQLYSPSEVIFNPLKEHEKLVMIMKNLSKTPKGVEMLYRARSIPELVALLAHNNGKYVSYALSTLHSLVRHKGTD